MSKIVVIGSLNVDMNIRVDDFPLEGETIKGYDMSYSEGGKGANQACAVGKIFGESIPMLGCVGNDQFLESVLNKLKENNVNTEDIKAIDGALTGLAVVCLDKLGRNNIIIIENANGLCDADYIDEKIALIDEADYVLLQNEIPMETIKHIIDKAKKKGTKVIFNPAPAPDSLEESLISKIDFITPNESELKSIVPDSSDEPLENAEKLIKMGLENVIVTLGEKGSLYVNKEGHRYIPGRKVKTVNTVGAGDVFNGAFIGHLAKNRSVLDAIEFANAAAALSVTKEGTIDSIPTYSEVMSFMEKV